MPRNSFYRTLPKEGTPEWDEFVRNAYRHGRTYTHHYDRCGPIPHDEGQHREGVICEAFDGHQWGHIKSDLTFGPKKNIKDIGFDKKRVDKPSQVKMETRCTFTIRWIRELHWYQENWTVSWAPEAYDIKIILKKTE